MIHVSVPLMFLQMSPGPAALVLLLLCAGADGFGIVPSDSLNHQEITETALLEKTVEVCRALAQAEGTNFNAPVGTLSNVLNSEMWV